MGGGARIGAGRKPRNVEHPVINADLPVDRPADLEGREAELWDEIAPLARDMETLTVHTARVLRALVEQLAELEAMRAEIAVAGRTFEKVTIDGSGQENRETKAHPLLGKVHALYKQTEVLLRAFRLAPNGRPIATTDRKPDDQADRFFDDAKVVRIG